MINIRKSLSAKLSICILLLAAPIFIISLGVLFTQSRNTIKRRAVDRANSVLAATMQRVSRNLSTIETATNANAWLVPRYLHPDSILTLSNRIVRLNPHIDGCSISTEPDIFPKYGRYFSAYTVREPDTISTVIEKQYEYFEKIWYKKPHVDKKPCWVVYYDESDSLALTLDGMIASYSKPIYDDNGRFIAVISTDRSLFRLSSIVSAEEKPYTHAYFMMVDNEGRYFIHPDSTRLFKQTIFSGVDPQSQSDLIALGHEMTKGKKGSMSAEVDGEPSLVCYQPVPGTTWSLALVCPDRDVLEGYNKLANILLPLVVIGILVILLLCHRTVAHAIRPINELLGKTQIIASGNMEVYIAKTDREDAIGRLQNSFARMMQYMNFHMGSVRYTTEQAKRRNEELEKTTRLAQEADRQKTAFIQNVSHQIRTPLNIIMGFAQILKKSEVMLSDEDMKGITATMCHNAVLLKRLVAMLFDSSDTGLYKELNSHKHDWVYCNEVAREAIGYVNLYYANITVEFQTELDDDFRIQTNHTYLMISLRELLYNAVKYSDRQHVSMSITRQPTTVRFIVQDTGKGIDEADRERMFKFFVKVDDLSEGLGLGLPLSKRHAQNLGGDLTLDEDYHHGCRFIMELPITGSE